MKRVSFRSAKFLKQVGYPQSNLAVWYSSNGTIITIHPKEGIVYYVAPLYLEVWLWLEREKGIAITLEQTPQGLWRANTLNNTLFKVKFDPEEAIIAVIKELIKCNLIK